MRVRRRSVDVIVCVAMHPRAADPRPSRSFQVSDDRLDPLLRAAVREDDGSPAPDAVRVAAHTLEVRPAVRRESA